MKHIPTLCWLGLGLFLIVFGCNSPDEIPKGDAALVASNGSRGQEKNDQGVEQYQQRKWEQAEKSFREAIHDDPKLAEAHYNLGLTLDKKGAHVQAADSFRKAVEIGSSKWELQESIILKEHLGM